MKGLKSFYAICLGTLAFCGAGVAGVDTPTRGGARRNIESATQTSRTESSTQPQNIVSARTTTKQTTVRNPIKNTATSYETRTATQPSRTISQRGTTTTSRATTARTASPRNTRTGTRTARTSTTRGTVRAATINESGALVTNYKQCREIYYECMDEFCAVKDANLRRCACSVRYNEFDDVKKQMSNVQDKMLDFNQRLLMVNMDADDAKVINTATQGEDAFYATTDNTKSKRALDEIAKKLNAKFGETDSGTSLSPISWSLNIDTAFDTVNSFGGIDTTTKSGTALYAAAIPICREIAAEVCDDDELSLAISGYQMLIEQDCNTVQKSYRAQVDAARAKVFESSALLDMSRLDTYQQKNSDDILTCRRKMLDMLTNSTICGANMEQCLDMTGRYIDPTTGTAFLTQNLSDLDGLITRPGTNQTWTTANSGSAFITYLNNRKKYLEPAMANCVDIADSVWDAFIEDALAQIKLAQTAKLEEIRRACTTLTSECLTNAADTISNFDARALSIFGVAADRTANALCRDVTNSCAALIDSDGISTWESGVFEIATDKTYDTIISSCTQVGRNCIIQACKSISGNFELCDDMDFSANRHAILERTACWPDVMNCVAAAGDDTLQDIIKTQNRRKNGSHNYAFYDDLYGNLNISPINDLCSGVCGGTLNAECAKCRITERIWGNCEASPSTAINDTPEHNRILMPKSQIQTLMSWFAINTGTVNSANNVSLDRSCINTRCTGDQTAIDINGKTICLGNSALTDVTSDGLYCPASNGYPMQVQNNITNCCFNNSTYWGHTWMGTQNICCEGTVQSINNQQICTPNQTFKLLATKSDGTMIICIGSDEDFTGQDKINNFPNGQSIVCNGTFITVNPNTGIYDEQQKTGNSYGGTKYTPRGVYYNTDDDTHASPINANQPPYFIHYDVQ